MTIRTEGLDRVVTGIKQKIAHDLWEFDAIPESIEDCQQYQTCCEAATIGQLWTIAHLGSRLKGLKLHSVDPKDGTIYLTISGLTGGMDPEGNIHT